MPLLLQTSSPGASTGVPSLPGPPFLEHYVFENPWPLIAALTALVVVLFAFGRARLKSSVLLALAGACVVLAISVYVSARLVATPRELVVARTSDLVGAVAQGDVSAARTVLSSDAILLAYFTSSSGEDIDGVLRRVGQMKSGPYQVRSHSIREVQVQFLGPRVARTQILVRVEPEATRFPTLSWWRVDWRSDAPGEWKAYEIQPLALPGIDDAGPR